MGTQISFSGVLKRDPSYFLLDRSVQNAPRFFCERGCLLDSDESGTERYLTDFSRSIGAVRLRVRTFQNTTFNTTVRSIIQQQQSTVSQTNLPLNRNELKTNITWYIIQNTLGFLCWLYGMSADIQGMTVTLEYDGNKRLIANGCKNHQRISTDKQTNTPTNSLMNITISASAAESAVIVALRLTTQVQLLTCKSPHDDGVTS